MSNRLEKANEILERAEKLVEAHYCCTTCYDNILGDIRKLAAIEAVPEEQGNQRIDCELAKIKDHVSKQSEQFADVIIMIDELTGQVNGLKSRVGSKDDLLVRLQTKVENLDSRLDLNVTARKELKYLQHKVSGIERQMDGIHEDLKILSKRTSGDNPKNATVKFCGAMNPTTPPLTDVSEAVGN